MLRRIKRSTLWSYFDAEGQDYAKCKMCAVRVSYKSTISNLGRHIKRRHPEVDLTPFLELDERTVVNYENEEVTAVKTITRDKDESNNDNKTTLFLSPEPMTKKKKVDDLETISAAVSMVQKSDEYDIFGEYVASEIRTIRSELIRRRLKSEIRKAIVRAADEDDDNSFGPAANSTTTIENVLFMPSIVSNNAEQQSTSQCDEHLEVTVV